jgi:AcrR family transcriptional regulator
MTGPIPTVDATTNPRAPWAKSRILETANELFYDDGIRTVGVDRLISESSVTKATFYKHYGSKDKLIEQYIRHRSALAQARLAAAIAQHENQLDTVRMLLAGLIQEISTPGYRGCPFLNAASEYPDPSHPVRILVSEHRDWVSKTVTGMLTEIGHPLPGDAADELLLAADGARMGGYAGDPIAATAAFSRAVERVLNEARTDA